MKQKAIGLMSGTSLDGIDVLIADIEGSYTDTIVKEIAFETIPFKAEVLTKINNALQENCSAKLLCSLNVELAHEYARAIKETCSKHSIVLKDIDYIASHGQTIYHINEETDDFIPSSLQLGDGSILANLLQTTVVSNFRNADIALSGKGAPLVPYADYVLYFKEGRVMHNLGGISNLTVLTKDFNNILAFDTGPGNMMIDYAMKKLFDLPYDKNGHIAKKGTVIDSLLSELMSHPYINKSPSKSTGREEFGDQYTDLLIEKYKYQKNEDLVRTFTEFTIDSIVYNYKEFVQKKIKVTEAIFSGGGAYNTFMIEMLKEKLYPIKVKTLEELEYNSSSKEALAFIILGNETLKGIPNNVPSATGSTRRTILGTINPIWKD